MGKRISLTTSLASHNYQVSKGIKSLHRSHCSLGTQLRHSPMQSLFSTRDTNVRWQSDVDTVAKFLPVVAFGYQPILTTKVDYLIDPLQFLDVRLKSRSLDVWDYLENASYSRFHVYEVHPDCSSIAVGTQQCRVPTSVVYLTNLKSAVSHFLNQIFPSLSSTDSRVCSGSHQL